MKYDFAAIEKKWQDKWEQEKPYAAVTGDPRPKFYGLIEFPYPSAAGLHVGHPRPFTAMDIICRKKRMQGYNVLNRASKKNSLIPMILYLFTIGAIADILAILLADCHCRCNSQRNSLVCRSKKHIKIQTEFALNCFCIILA